MLRIAIIFDKRRSFRYYLISIMRSLGPRFLERIQYSGADAAILRALGEAKGRQALFSR